MPRPISWLPRLHEIARSVANSVRSHYDRRDIEKLFELQPRAAQMLLEMLPTVQVGTSMLVERETLGVFLDRVRESENTAELFAQVRKEKTQSSRRRIRPLVRRDLDPVGLGSLPDSMSLSPGRLEVRFQTVEELCEAMLLLARVLTDDLSNFASTYASPVRSADDPLQDEMAHIFEELAAMEAEKDLIATLQPSRAISESLHCK